MIINRLALVANPGGALRSCPPALHVRLAARLRRVALCLATASAVHAGDAESVRLTWNRNPEPDIARYELACGTAAGVYTRTIDAGNEIGATANGLDEGTIYHFAVAAINEAGLKSPYSDEVIYFSGFGDELSAGSWTSPTAGGENAFDGDAATLFLAGPAGNGVHDLEIALGSASSIEGLRYLPRRDGSTVGNILRYEIYLSEDGVNWGNPVAAGVFAKTSDYQEVRFAAQNASFLRLRSLEEASGLDECAVAELDIIEASGPITGNQPPTAIAAEFSGFENQAREILLSATDADGDPLQYSIATPPGHGTLSGAPPALLYTPSADFHGADSFSFTVTDGRAASAPAQISLNIAPVNKAPSALAQALSTPQNTALPVLLSGADPNGDPLAFSLVTPPQHGSLAGSPPNLLYTPDPGFLGDDGFAFQVSDGSATSAPAAISIAVRGVNSAPFAIQAVVTGATNIPQPFVLSATDADGDTLAYSLRLRPAYGVITGTPPNLIYNPAPGFQGLDMLSFIASDGNASSKETIVAFIVMPANVPPVATAQAVATSKATPAAIVLAATDANGNPLTFAIASPPAHGTLSGTPPAVIYTPAGNHTGSDSFTFVASDGAANSAPAIVSIQVNDTNALPAAIAQTVTTAKRAAVSIRLSATDADDDKLAFAIVSAPAHGALSGTAPDLTYTPAGNYVGSDSFTFVANDGAGDSAPATVSVVVENSNSAPTADAAAFATAEDTAIPIVLTAGDPDDDGLTFEIAAPPAHGVLTGTAPNLIYTPAANFHGTDAFGFRASDSAEMSATAVVSITVTPVNDLPVVASRTLLTSKRTPAPITLFATDPDEDPLVFKVLSQPAHGTLSGTPPTLIYTPDGNYTGADQFKYRANDGYGDSPPATVFISIAPANERPRAIAQSLATLRNSPVAITLAATDADGDPLTWSTSAAAHGTLTGTAPALTYQPADGFTGTDSFTFVANDGTENSLPATVTIAISKETPFAGGKILPRAGWSLVSADSGETAHPAGAAFDGDPSTCWHTAAGTPAPHEILLDLGATADICGFQYLPGPDSGNVAAYEFLISADGVTWGTPAAAGAFADAAGEKQVLFTTVTGRFVRFRALSSLDGSDAACIAELNVIAGQRANRRPIAIPKILSADAAAPLAVDLTSADPDGDAVSHRIATPPAHGVLSGKIPNLVYISEAGFEGWDSFSFIANDGAEDSKPATISISVIAGPGTGTGTTTPPVIDPSSTIIRGVRDVSFAAKISATDSEGDRSLNFEKVSGPAWITVEPDGSVRGIPREAASFEVVVTDRHLVSASATIRIVLVEKPENHAPEFARAILDFPACTELVAHRAESLASFATDPDPADSLVFSKVSGPAWLRIDPSGAVSGTAPEGSAGVNSFVVRATDPAGANCQATLRIEVRPNRLPLPWTLSQLGRDTLAYFANFRAGVVTLGGSGTLGKSADDAAFAWQKLNGDGEITVRLKDSESAGKSARVGIAIRESLAADARAIFLGVDGNGKIKWVRRTASHGKSATATRGESASGWLRLSRSGRVVTAWRSDDGKAWESLGKTKIRLPKSSYIGLSVSSGRDSATSSAKFRNIRVTP